MNKRILIVFGVVLLFTIISLVINAIKYKQTMDRYDEYIKELEEEVYEYEIKNTIWEKEKDSLYRRIDSTGRLYKQSKNRIDSILAKKPKINDHIRDSIRKQLENESL